MEIQQHDGVVVDVAGLRQGFAKLLTGEERCWGGEGLRLGCRVQPSPCPSIYRGRRVHLHTLVDR